MATKKADKIEIDKYFVLNCRAYYPEEVFKDLIGAIVCGYAQEGQGRIIPIGTPCLATKDFLEGLEEEEHSNNRILLYFPPKANIPAFSTNVLSKVLTISKDIKSPIDFLNVKHIECLDIDKLDRLIEYIHDVGGISFTLSEREKRGKETLDFIKKMRGRFSLSFDVMHSIPRQGEYIESGFDNDELISLVSFFDIKTILPIVDIRKTDGIGITFEHFLSKHCEAKRAKEVTDFYHVILSNYKENIIIADGSVMNAFSSFAGGSSAEERIKALLNRRAMTKATNKKRKSESNGPTLEVKIKRDDTIELKEATTYYYTTYNTSTSTSNTF